MANSFQETATYFILHMTILITTGFICLFLIIIHIFRYYKNEISETKTATNKHSLNKKRKKTSPINKAINILTLIMIISMSMGPISNIFPNIYLIFNPSSTAMGCHIINNSKDVIVYYIGKICMFLIFILRLHSIYGSSAFAYKPIILKIFAMTITTTMIILCILTVIETKPVWLNFNVFGQKYRNCTTVFPFYYIVFYGLHEIIVTTITLIMFIIPLRKLLHTIKSNGGSSNKSTHFKFKRVAIKVCK